MKLALDTASGVPFYRQIIQQVENAVLAGKLLAGEKLPTIRSLAIELKINPNTIAKAYNELELKGVVITQVGSGTFISDKMPEINETERKMNILKAVGKFLHEMDAFDVRDEEISGLITEYRETLEE